MVTTPSKVREPAIINLQFELQGIRWETFQALTSSLSQEGGYQLAYDQDTQVLLISQQGQGQYAVITLKPLSWETFKNLMTDVGDGRGWRFAYDNGVLEIRMPLPLHEEPKVLIANFIEAWVDALDIEARQLGALTLEREGLKRAIEPDTCFYIQNEALVRGKNSLDLKTLPPPDLAVESDHTNSSLNKFNIYAALGVPELWLYRKQRIEVYLLTEGRYELSDTSLALPLFPIQEAETLIEQNGKMGQRAIVRQFRAQIQELLQTR
jgi:Uma2 family endonuclease